MTIDTVRDIDVDRDRWQLLSESYINSTWAMSIPNAGCLVRVDSKKVQDITMVFVPGVMIGKDSKGPILVSMR